MDFSMSEAATALRAELRRLPLGVSATREALTRRLGRAGLTGLFSEAQ